MSRTMVRFKMTKDFVEIKTINRDWRKSKFHRYLKHDFLIEQDVFEKALWEGERVFSRDIHSFIEITPLINELLIRITWLNSGSDGISTRVEGAQEEVLVDWDAVDNWYNWTEKGLEFRILENIHKHKCKFTFTQRGREELRRVITNPVTRNKFRRIIPNFLKHDEVMFDGNWEKFSFNFAVINQGAIDYNGGLIFWYNEDNIVGGRYSIHT